jgi:hypothetical protein
MGTREGTLPAPSLIGPVTDTNKCNTSQPFTGVDPGIRVGAHNVRHNVDLHGLRLASTQVACMPWERVASSVLRNLAAAAMNVAQVDSARGSALSMFTESGRVLPVQMLTLCCRQDFTWHSSTNNSMIHANQQQSFPFCEAQV